MTPLDAYIDLCRTNGNSPAGRAQLRLAHDNFIHAETLSRHLERCGLPVHAVVERDDDAVTIVLCVSAPPPALVEALEDGQLAHRAYDFKCTLDHAYAVYHVDAHGVTLPVVAEMRLVAREDRAGLIAPADKVAA